MRTQRSRHRCTAGLVALIALSLLVIPATADNAWGDYHWARTSNTLEIIKTGNNVSGTWEPYLDEAISDWNRADSPDLVKVAGGVKSPKSCKAASGKIEVCNAKYGNNGWLGLAQIWVSGSHITKAVSKLNDTYFETLEYNKPEWRHLVMCQELAHDFGLDHQDETHDNPNLGSCMDYTSNPLGPPSNEHPNSHDYEQLEVIYSHTDTTTTIGSSSSGSGATGEIGNEASEWGRAIRFDDRGRPILFERDLRGNERVFTWVIWTLEARGQGPERAAVAPADSTSEDTAKANGDGNKAERRR